MHVKSHTILESLAIFQQEGYLTDFTIINGRESIEVFKLYINNPLWIS